MSTRYKGSLMSSTAAVTNTITAPGIWRSNEVMQAILTAWPIYGDAYWTSVSLLLHGNGTNGAQNNTFIDSSINAFTITRNGSPTQGSVTPFTRTAPYSTSVSGGSGYFNGTTDYLSTPQNAAYNFGTGDFTVEGFFYFWGSFTSVYNALINLGNGASGGGPFTGWGLVTGSTGGDIRWYRYDGTTETQYIGTYAFSVGTWYHIAVTRSGTSLAIFVNGVRIVTTTSSISYNNINADPLNIAYRNDGVSGVTYAKIYTSNIRIVKGTAVYNPTLTTLTVPTSPLTAITNTSLLFNFINAGVYDNAMLNNCVTVGTAQISTTQFKFGTGSILFSGAGSYLSFPDTSNLQMATGDFTIEGWVYLSTNNILQGIVGKGTSTTGWSIDVSSLNKLQFNYTTSSVTGATSLNTATWYYFAVVRSGSATGNVKIYLNGTVDATSGTAITDNFNQTSIFYAGLGRGGSNQLNGYIDDFRVTKGVARTISTPTSAFLNQ